MRTVITDTDYWDGHAINTLGRWLSFDELSSDDVIIAKANDISALNVSQKFGCHHIGYYSDKVYEGKNGRFQLGGSYNYLLKIPEASSQYPNFDVTCFDEPTPKLISVIRILTNKNYCVGAFADNLYPDYRNYGGKVTEKLKLQLIANSIKVLTDDEDFGAQLWVSEVPNFSSVSLQLNGIEKIITANYKNRGEALKEVLKVCLDI